MGDEKPELTDDELAFLHATLDLARNGAGAELADRIRRGVPANLTGAGGDSLLILAAYHDHPDTVGVLLDAGADPNRVNDRGQTALAAAVFRQNARSVRLLLDAGADPSAGERCAYAIADFFDLPAMRSLLGSG